MTAAMNHTKTTTPGVDANASTSTLASQDVGLLFVREYYTFLNKKPLRLHAFYNKDSFFVRGDEGESVQTYHGQDEIRQKIEALNFEDCKVLVTQVDSQASANNGILIQVLGEMCVKDGPSQKFSQTFFLAPQPNGYYVLNDIFRFLKDEVDIDYYTCEDQNQQQQQQQQPAAIKKEEDTVAQAPVEKQQDESAPSIANKDRQEQQDEIPVSVDEPKPEEKVKKPAVNGVTAATPEKNKQQQQPSQKPAVEKTADAPSPTPPAPALPRSWANLAANDSSKWGTQVSEAKGSVAATSTPAPTATPSQQQQTPPAAKEQQQQQQQQQSNKEQQQRKDEVTNIFIKNVTAAVTEDQLMEAFSKFGPVKGLNIVVGRNCAFLDFTTPAACQKALAQHKVNLNNGMVVLAEERRRPYGGKQQQSNGNYERRQQQQGSYRRAGGGRNNPATGSNKSRSNAAK